MNIYMGSNTDLWTDSFTKLCIGNFLFFISTYMLLPVLPVYADQYFDIGPVGTGLIIAGFAFALYIIGPFYSYLTDQYNRKNICIISFLLTAGVISGYLFVDSPLYLFILRFIHGLLFGVATSLSTTLVIDITVSSRRTDANTAFNWSTLFGILSGLLIGLLFYKSDGFTMVLYVSIALTIIGLFLISMVKAVFRAPIGVPLVSIDRFFLPAAFWPALILLIISFSFGSLVLIMSQFSIIDFIPDYSIVLFMSLIGIGFALSIAAMKYKFINLDNQIITGMVLMIIAFFMLIRNPILYIFVLLSLLIGIGVGLSFSGLLIKIINLSDHCQRETANATYLLAWETGIALSFIFVSYLTEHFELIIFVLLLSLLFYSFFIKSKKDNK